MSSRGGIYAYLLSEYIYIYVCLYAKENEGDQGFPLMLHYDELYNYFIIYHSVIIIEIKCTINAMHLNHPQTIHLPPPGSVEKLSSMKLSLMPKRLGTTALEHLGLSPHTRDVSLPLEHFEYDKCTLGKELQ